MPVYFNFLSKLIYSKSTKIKIKVCTTQHQGKSTDSESVSLRQDLRLITTYTILHNDRKGSAVNPVTMSHFACLTSVVKLHVLRCAACGCRQACTTVAVHWHLCRNSCTHRHYNHLWETQTQPGCQWQGRGAGWHTNVSQMWLLTDLTDHSSPRLASVSLSSMVRHDGCWHMSII